MLQMHGESANYHQIVLFAAGEAAGDVHANNTWQLASDRLLKRYPLHIHFRQLELSKCLELPRNIKDNPE